MQSVGSFEGWGVSLKHPVLESISSLGEWRVYYMPRAGISLVHKSLGGRGGVLTPSAAICLVIRREGSVLKVRDENLVVLGRWGVSLTRPVLVCVSSTVGAKFLLHAPC